MYIKNLKLKNYRNYKEISVDFDKKINIIYGNNAEGKTNILESIYVLATSKSHKNCSEKEIINFNENEAHIKSVLIRDEIEEKEDIVDIQINKESKKGIAVNGLKQEKLSDYLGFVNVSMFAPEDLYIIKERPQARRKFLDVELCQIDKIYVNNLSNYNKILNQRNALLKDINFTNNVNKKEMYEILNTYDEKLVEEGTNIIIKRKNNIEEIKNKIINIYNNISDNKEKFNIEYDNDILESVEDKENEEEIKEKYFSKLKEARKKDEKNMFSYVGPHRDDIKFYVDENDIRAFGSQGQKKLTAISLKLTELEIIKEKTKNTPILLLDDVFSELDETRQKLLIKNLENIQTIITCTGMKKNIFDLLKANKLFKVENGMILEKKKE